MSGAWGRWCLEDLAQAMPRGRKEPTDTTERCGSCTPLLPHVVFSSRTLIRLIYARPLFKNQVNEGSLEGSGVEHLPSDPGVLGLSPALGSLHGACFSLCLCLCLPLCVSHEWINKKKFFFKSHSSGGSKSKIKVPANLIFGEGPLLGL